MAKMKYIEYLTNAASRAQQFGSDCLGLAGEVAAALPEKAATIGAITAEYATAAAAASSDFVAEASYESYNAIIDASSRLAETLGDAVVNAPSYIASLAGTAEDYSTAAIAAAQAYLAAPEQENHLEWLQVQDDGVYISGKGDSSPSFPWPDIIPTTRPPRRKYPEGVPLVPPQPITTGTPKIKKIKPITPNGSGCVNKIVPTPGKFWLAIEAPYVGGLVALLYWDNMTARRTWFTHNDPQMYWEDWFTGSPLGMPSELDAELMSTFKKGRYAITGVSHNETLYNPTAYPYYIMSEGWGWEYKFPDGTTATSQHGDDWEECLFLEFGSSYYYYHFPNSAGNWTTEGEGHAAAFTCGRVHLTYLGDTFAPVEETPENVGAYLAFNQIQSFQNILHVLGIGGKNGNS